MARPKTPTNILDARGAFKKNPKRARPNEPEVKGKIDAAPPQHLDAHARMCWQEIKDTVPAGVLTASDTLIVEVVAVLLSEFRVARSTMSDGRLTRMTTLMGRLGLDPSGRASLVVEKPKDNPFDEF